MCTSAASCVFCPQTFSVQYFPTTENQKNLSPEARDILTFRSAYPLYLQKQTNKKLKNIPTCTHDELSNTVKSVSAHRVSPENPWWSSYETDICMCVTDGWYYSQRVPRTGWVYRNVKKPESVSDHMYRMAMMSLTITDPTVDRDRWVPYTWKSVFTPLSKRKAEKHINVPLFMCYGSLPVKKDFFLSDWWQLSPCTCS